MPHNDIIYDLILLFTDGSLSKGKKRKSRKRADLLLVSEIPKTHLLYLLILQERVSALQAGLRHGVTRSRTLIHKHYSLFATMSKYPSCS